MTIIVVMKWDTYFRKVPHSMCCITYNTMINSNNFHHQIFISFQNDPVDLITVEDIVRNALMGATTTVDLSPSMLPPAVREVITPTQAGYTMTQRVPYQTAVSHIILCVIYHLVWHLHMKSAQQGKAEFILDRKRFFIALSHFTFSHVHFSLWGRKLKRACKKAMNKNTCVVSMNSA